MVMTVATDIRSWIANRIKRDEITRYMDGDRCFIDDGAIEGALERGKNPDPGRVREILAKSLAIETLTVDEAACLLHVEDPDLWEEMQAAAGEVKRRVYDNRIVTFAPLYMANLCVNGCVYCGFRSENNAERRRVLTMEEIREETRVLAGTVGHKRLIVVYGEHPASDYDYIADSIRAIYDVTVPTKKGYGAIRRVNVNAAPMEIAHLKVLHDVGIGTFQVFQETYHRPTYERLHPAGTIKGDYLWRLYAMHRCLEAGIDDVGIGALFGLHDWRYEVLGLLQHAWDLEEKFGIGPHTVSFPRIEPATNTPYADSPEAVVDDDAFARLVTVLRLAIPYTGMILTARERGDLRHKILPLGCTQVDASSRIGIGAYADVEEDQKGERQQFILGDTRSLDEVVRQLALDGYITSFCTAGYRCGRTGQKIMDLLRSGREGHFCKLNAVLTFREWLDDFASEETRVAGEKVLAKELAEIALRFPDMYPRLRSSYEEVSQGARDVYF